MFEAHKLCIQTRSINRTLTDVKKIMLGSFVNQYKVKYKLINKLNLEKTIYAPYNV